MCVRRQVIGFSSLPDEEVFALENSFGAQHYSRLKVVIRKTDGVWLIDQKGRKLFDCLAAYSAANQGHHHPYIVNAAIAALRGGYASVISNVVSTDTLALFEKKIAELLPQLGARFGCYGNKVLLKNGGVESFETAVKMARHFGYSQKGIPDGCQRIIVFRNNFHGRTGEAISASSTEKYKEGFSTRRGAYINHVEFGDLEAAEGALNSDVCAIIVEPMQGEGGMNIPPEGFLKGLRKIADEHNILLIFDEIQVGLGRTGKMFCFEHEGVVPDAIILGKALSGGIVPVSAFVANKKIMDLAFTPGKDGSTFGGYPLACVAGIAALDVIENENLVDNAARKGIILKKRIEEIISRSKCVKEVRGRGLFIGIEVKNGNAMAYCRQLLDLGLLANDSHGHTIRISPPLIITMEHIDYICEKLEKVLVG